MNLWSWLRKPSLLIDFLETSIECFAGYCSSQWVQTRLLRIIHRPAKPRVIVPGYSPKNLGTNFWNRMVNRFLKHPLACYCLNKWQNDSPLHGIRDILQTSLPSREHFLISIFQANIWKSWKNASEAPRCFSWDYAPWVVAWVEQVSRLKKLRTPRMTSADFAKASFSGSEVSIERLFKNTFRMSH